MRIYTFATNDDDNMEIRAYIVLPSAVVRLCIPRSTRALLKQRINRAQAAREITMLRRLQCRYNCARGAA